MNLEHSPKDEYANLQAHGDTDAREGARQSSLESQVQALGRSKTLIGESFPLVDNRSGGAERSQAEALMLLKVLEDSQREFPEQFKWMEEITFEDSQGKIAFRIDKWHNLTHLAFPRRETPETLREDLRRLLECLKARRTVVKACKQQFGKHIAPDLSATFPLGDSSNIQTAELITRFLNNVDVNSLPVQPTAISFRNADGIHMLVRGVNNA